jgi:hypothetical protein
VAPRGLRFDRVVQRVMGELRAFTDQTVSPGVTVLLSLTAPIRLPARTVDELRQAMTAFLAASDPPREWQGEVNGNSARLRLIAGKAAHAPSLIGFVHNRECPCEPLFAAATRWARAGGEARRRPDLRSKP